MEKNNNIKTWKEFEVAVIALNRNTEYDLKDKMEEIRKIRSAYLKGTDDLIERRLREEQIAEICFYPTDAHMFNNRDDASLKERIEKAKALDRAYIELKIKKQEEAIEKLMKEEEEYKQGIKQAYINNLKPEYRYDLKYKKREPQVPVLIRKIKSERYMLSPRYYNYILYKTNKSEGRIELPNYSTKAEALLDLLFTKMAEKENYGLLKAKDDKVLSIEEFQQICKHKEEFSTSLKTITFETSEIRKLLNVPCSWTDQRIVEAAYELREKPIIIEDVRIYADEKGKYQNKITANFGTCHFVVANKTDKIAPKTKNIQHQIAFGIDAITEFLFRNEIIRQRYSLFPTKEKDRSFYRKKHGVTRLYRYLSLWDYAMLTMPMVMSILRYSEKTNVTQIQNKVRGYLNDMVEAGLIREWMSPCDEVGMKAKWMIGVTKSLADYLLEQGRKLEKKEANVNKRPNNS